MKYACIIYHKNHKQYPSSWIKKCIESIQAQTFQSFDVWEMDYGGGKERIYPGSNFSSTQLSTHSDAHNYLLDLVFSNGYDYAFNVNIDDYYDIHRFEKQAEVAEKGFDVISSNFFNIDENDKITCINNFHEKSLIQEANIGINIISHPVCCYSKRFWCTCTKLIPSEIPKDDFLLWKRSYVDVHNDYYFLVLPYYLHYYRVHSRKVSKPQEEKTTKATGEKVIKKNFWTDEEQKRIHDAKRDEWLKSNP